MVLGCQEKVIMQPISRSMQFMHCVMDMVWYTSLSFVIFAAHNFGATHLLTTSVPRTYFTGCLSQV
jgi:acyl-coenzyme A synthetase/AMP-(fatty) acid ligase